MEQNDNKSFSSRDSSSRNCPRCHTPGVSSNIPYPQGEIVVHQMKCPSCGCVYIWNERI